MSDPSTHKPSPSAHPASIRRLPDGSVEIGWSDGVRSPYSPRLLRDACPCATCHEERAAPKPKGLLTVLSPQELHLAPGSPETFLRIVPGIRAVAGTDDQQRVASAYDAVRGGASLIVVGRPIVAAADPRAAALAILAEIDRGLIDRNKA